MENKTSKLAIASLVLGIISLISIPTIFLSLVCGILAIIFGVVSKKNVTETNQSNKGLAIGGLVTGIVGAIGSVLLCVLVLTQVIMPLAHQKQMLSYFKKDNVEEKLYDEYPWGEIEGLEDPEENYEFTTPTTVGVNNNTKELYENGYVNNMTSISNNEFKTLFEKGNSYIVASATLTQEELKLYNSVPVGDENYDENKKAVIISFNNVTLKDVSDKVPTEKDLEKYVGSTLGDLEKAGYEKSGYSADEKGELLICYGNGTYNISVSLDDKIVVEDLDDLSENDIRAFKVDKIYLDSLDFGILED